MPAVTPAQSDMYSVFIQDSVKVVSLSHLQGQLTTFWKGALHRGAALPRRPAPVLRREDDPRVLLPQQLVLLARKRLVVHKPAGIGGRDAVLSGDVAVLGAVDHEELVAVEGGVGG
eukprot:3852082-Rhodomonas_salina.1